MLVTHDSAPPSAHLRMNVVIMLCVCSEPREVEVDRRCEECHPECLLQDGTPTCRGPVSLAVSFVLVFI